MSKENNFDDLMASYLDGSLTQKEFEQLVNLLSNDPGAVKAFVQAARSDALLEEAIKARRQEADAEQLWNRMGTRYLSERQCALDVSSGETAVRERREPSAPTARGKLLAVGLAVGLLLAITIGLFVNQSWRKSPHPPEPNTLAATAEQPGLFATLRRTKQLNWGEFESLDVGDRLGSGQVIRFKKGMAEIVFDSGTVVVLNAPADAVIKSNRLLELRRGTITANVAKGDEGFRVDTQRAAVVDLSTAFGVSMPDGQETNVVVFDGKVDLHLGQHLTEDSANGNLRQSASRDVKLRHMTSGDGLQIDARGQVKRLVAINSTAFPTSLSWDLKPGRNQPLIAAVRDNLREGETTKCYRIVPEGLNEDAPAYVDRVYEWNGITTEGMPEFLLGADYVMMFNDDKYVSQLEMEVTVSAAANLYVFIDNRVKTPAWLTREFADTGFDIGLDEVHYPPREHDKPKVGPGVSINSEFSIWRRELPHAMTVRLGSLGIREIFDATDTAMYSIAAVPLVRGE